MSVLAPLPTFSPVAAYVNGVVLPVDGGFMAMRALAAPETCEPIGRR